MATKSRGRDSTDIIEKRFARGMERSNRERSGKFMNMVCAVWICITG